VVQSPMLSIPKFDTWVPVKRFNGEGENSVCFLPRRDIEKDASNVYEKECVSKNPLWADAHGVAITNSDPDEEFEYEVGHRFWIMIGASPSQHSRMVPVINLDTFATGSVDIEHVCWVPKYQGPGSEIYTLGGQVRKLKHSGSRNFSFWSWAICQQLSGPTVTKNVEIPKSEGSLLDRMELLGIRRRTLFEAKFKAMVEEYSKALIEPPQLNSITGLLTPPSSPTAADPALLGFSETSQPTVTELSNSAQAVALNQPNMNLSAPDIWPEKVPVAQICQSIGDQRKQSKIVDPPISIAAIQARVPRPPASQTNTLMSIRRIIEQNVLSMEQNMVSLANNSTALSHWIVEPPSCKVSQQRSYSDRSSMSDVSEAASTLIDLSHKATLKRHSVSGNNQTKAVQRLSSVQYLITGCTSFAELCDRVDVDCSYIRKFTFKHFHSSGDTCQLSHVDHCVSKLETYPEKLRICLLSDLPSERRHQCCQDCGHSQSQKRTFSARKVVEAKRMKHHIYNTWHGIERPG